ncbi:GNAT family N-acetyltransferase [Streptacidiphilus sp. EB103A]|uniref:GNAT family N-acetyltransferase n=1 Tax=Streptacidiphilus sp. EB103A TaxID=3156275 RepID=UPI0035151225
MGEAVTVREAAAADLDAAVALWTLSHVVRRNGRPLPEAHIVSAHQRMASPEALVLLAHDSGDGADESHGEPDGKSDKDSEHDLGIIGTIMGVQGRDDEGAGPPVAGLVHISLLSVAPDRWGQHIGRLLVEETINRAVAGGFEQAQLWTHADNLRANRLYKAMGFRRSGRVKVDDWGELLVHYRRSLVTR